MTPAQGTSTSGVSIGVLRTAIACIFDDGVTDVKPRLFAIYVILGLLNSGAWIWALIAFHDKPELLGIALLVYGLGLRHAVDADHIAAIDNVTRKLMSEDKRPVSVGFFFALGHSTIVVLVAAAVAGATTMLATFHTFGETSGAISSAISAGFLIAIAAMNIAVFFSVWRTYRQRRADQSNVARDLNVLPSGRGLLTRLLHPLFRLVTKSWHMFPLGLLFGLGFDTATEVAMIGLSAAQAANGVPLHVILVFPLLFAASMSLIDTTDGVLMLRAYDWAFVEPTRRLRYNMAITLVSAIVAIVIGGVGAMSLATEKFGLSGGFWDLAEALNKGVKDFGFLLVGVFLAAWGSFYLVHRLKSSRLANAAPGRFS